MAVEQSGDKGKAEGAASADAAVKPEAAKSEIDDMKRKFREALERKREQAHANAEGTQATGKVHDAHGPASSRRSFRRKSGG
jgi:Family of unknown function (DUF5302)